MGVRHYVTRLVLVRHGQTDWNIQRRYQGKTDIPLNAVGRRQAASLARELSGTKLAAVYSSELDRAYETAALIAQPQGVAVIRDRRLNEIDQGEWEGLRHEDIADRYGERLRLWEEDPTSTCPPGGESLADVRQRVLECLHEILLKHPNDAVCVVAHKVTNAIIKSEVLGLSIAELMRQEPAHGKWEEVRVPKVPGKVLDKADTTN